MVSKKSFKGITQKLVGVITVDNERIEELRQILESEQNRPVTHEEAKNVGESLITVYKVLAGVITQERYKAKHESFMSEIETLEFAMASFDSSVTERKRRGI